MTCFQEIFTNKLSTKLSEKHSEKKVNSDCIKDGSIKDLLDRVPTETAKKDACQGSNFYYILQENI